MNALILYDSKYGNTEEIAEAIGAELQRHMPTRVVVATGEADLRHALEGVSLLVIGGPTQGHSVSPAMHRLVDDLEPGSLDGVAVATFDTRRSMPRVLSGSAAATLQGRLRRAGAKIVAPPASFEVTANEGPLVDGELRRAHAFGQSLAQH